MSLLIKAGITKLSELTIDADLAMGAHNITLDVAQTVDGVDVSSHESRHVSGGADDIDSALALGAIPTPLTGKDADSVDGKEPGTTGGDIQLYEAGGFERNRLYAPYVAGDNLLAAADTEAILNGTNAYAKKKEITINKSGILRVKFALARLFTGVGTIYGKIYRSGVAQGTERSLNVDSDGVVFSEDLPYVADDTCELWIRTDASNKTLYKNFRIYATPPPLAIPEVTLDG